MRFSARLGVLLGVLVFSVTCTIGDMVFAGEITPLGKAFYHFGQAAGGGFYDHEEQEWTWQGPTILAATGASAGLAYFLFDDPPGGYKHRGFFKPFTFWSEYVGFATTPAAFLLALLHPEGPKRDRWFSLSEQLFETMAWTIPTILLLKHTVSRTTPEGFENTSFPSGHSAFTFAPTTVFLMNEHYIVGGVLLAMSSLNAVGRYYLRAHHTSDILVGAGIGVFFGVSVSLFHQRKISRIVSLSPLVGETKGLLAQFKW